MSITTTVANQAACEALCSNNVKCSLYESRGPGYTSCRLYSFASGVTSVTKPEFDMLLNYLSGCITALKKY